VTETLVVIFPFDRWIEFSTESLSFVSIHFIVVYIILYFDVESLSSVVYILDLDLDSCMLRLLIYGRYFSSICQFFTFMFHFLP